MRTFEPTDPDRPIETYPGYIGMTWDAQPFFGPELNALEPIDWNQYYELLSDQEDERKIVVACGSDTFEVELAQFVETCDVAFLLDQLPTIDVHYDPGPRDGGPASGHGYVFFVADGVTTDALHRSVSALAKAVTDDLIELNRCT